MKITKTNKIFLLLGLIGYVSCKKSEYSCAKQLLEDNNYNFRVISDFYYELMNLNACNNTCSSISLSGVFPNIKSKDASCSDIEKIIHKHNINIELS